MSLQHSIGFRGLIRDASGHWVARFSISSSYYDILLVELLAILHGLQVAFATLYVNQVALMLFRL